jgi:hypothetical protein
MAVVVTGLGWQASGRAAYDGIDATIMSYQLRPV